MQQQTDTGFPIWYRVFWNRAMPQMVSKEAVSKPNDGWFETKQLAYKAALEHSASHIAVEKNALVLQSMENGHEALKVLAKEDGDA